MVWLVLYAVLKGNDTKLLGFQDTTGFHEWLNRVRDWVQLHGPGNWFFGGVLGGIGDGFNAVVTFLQELLSMPAFPRPVPKIGWLGVVAIAAWVAWALAGIRSTILVTVSLLLFGIFGYWQDSIDLLIITLVAVVFCVRHRPADRHRDGPQQTGLGRGHPAARRHADPPVVHLPGAVRAVLRHRQRRRRGRSPSSTRCRRWCGSPSTASAPCPPRPSRRPGRWA